MNPQRTTAVNGHKVSEYYWAGSYPVYVDNQLQEGESYEQVCQRLAASLSAPHQEGIASSRDGETK